MNNYEIIERRFALQHSLTRRVFGDVAFGRTYGTYSQIVYFDEFDPKVITAKLVYVHDKLDDAKSFSDLVIIDLTYDESLIAATLYFSCSVKIIGQIISEPLTPIEDYLEYILKPTNGYLIYTFQFELLAQAILNVSLSEAVRMRKLHNKQPNLVASNAAGNPNYQLFRNIVAKRCITKNVYQPNYEGAKNLMLYAESIA